MSKLRFFSVVKKVRYFSLTSLIALAGLTACSPDRPEQAEKLTGKQNSAANATDSTVKKTGEASWYGPGFEGQETASGETFKSDQMTAASPDLPLGSKVEVTNLDNKKKTEVRINDRGPYSKGRILDLSHGAAKKLGMTKKGKARVKIVAKRKPKIARKKKAVAKK